MNKSEKFSWNLIDTTNPPALRCSLPSPTSRRAYPDDKLGGRQDLLSSAALCSRLIFASTNELRFYRSRSVTPPGLNARPAAMIPATPLVSPSPPTGAAPASARRRDYRFLLPQRRRPHPSTTLCGWRRKPLPRRRPQTIHLPLPPGRVTASSCLHARSHFGIASGLQPSPDTTTSARRRRVLFNARPSSAFFRRRTQHKTTPPTSPSSPQYPAASHRPQTTLRGTCDRQRRRARRLEPSTTAY